MSQNAVLAQDVSFRYDSGKEGLKSITLTVREGEFTAVLGANGSGKSTLARHIVALLTPQSGSLRVLSYDAKDRRSIPGIRRSAGIVFQNPDNQFISSVAEEDTAFGPENYGLPEEEVAQRVDEALALCGMSAFRRRDPATLSGGEKQRLALAGVLAMRPRILIFDEAFSMLDPRGRRELSSKVSEVRKGRTIIFITHYAEEVTSADTVVVMKAGEVLAQGGARNILCDIPLLESAALRAPRAVYMARALRERGVPLEDGILTEEELSEALCRLL